MCLIDPEQAYVEAARALGTKKSRHSLSSYPDQRHGSHHCPVHPRMGTAILYAAGLGFLGLGVQPPTAEWGAMLGSGRSYLFANPHVATFPGMAIFFAVLGFNLFGDGLRDALDPRFKL